MVCCGCVFTVKKIIIIAAKMFGKSLRQHVNLLESAKVNIENELSTLIPIISVCQVCAKHN